MKPEILEQYRQQLREIRSSGLYKAERILQGPQNARVEVTGGSRC